MNNGSISITSHAGVPYARICATGEITLTDVEWSLAVLKRDFNNPSRIIVENSGTYSISIEAQKRLIYGFSTLREMIIIADNRTKLREALLAEKSYLMSVKITILHSLSDVSSYIA